MSIINVTQSSFHQLFEKVGVGFGTAALSGRSTYIVEQAIKNGFRKFDTAEESEHWYDQAALGSTLESLFVDQSDKTFNNCVASNDREENCVPVSSWSCLAEGLQISTKIPPWELTSAENIRTRALASRDQLIGFCPDIIQIYDTSQDPDSFLDSVPYPLDIYYIHAPQCWEGWHPRCHNVKPRDTLPLREIWQAMEAVVHTDRAATRIGLSNINEYELKDIIRFVKQRQRLRNTNYNETPPPRMPDVVQAYADPIHPATRLRKICRENNIEFVAYSTLGTQHWNAEQNPVLTHPTVINLSEKYQRSTAEVVLSWAISKQMSVIPRSTKPHHIEELSRLLDDKNTLFLEEYDLSLVDAMALD